MPRTFHLVVDNPTYYMRPHFTSFIDHFIYFSHYSGPIIHVLSYQPNFFLSIVEVNRVRILQSPAVVHCVLKQLDDFVYVLHGDFINVETCDQETLFPMSFHHAQKVQKLAMSLYYNACRN